MGQDPGNGRDVHKKSRTVLIADDDPDVLASTRALVEAMGYRAFTVSEAAEILEAAETYQPGVLLQDLRMPGLNLAGLVAALRSHPRTSEVHVVFFSAAEELPAVALRHRAWGHLKKPFRAEELAHMLELAFDGAPRHDPAAAKAVQEEVRSAFSDYWDLLAAAGNYLTVLGREASLADSSRAQVKGLGDVVLRLEARTERLRNHLLALGNKMEHMGATA